MNFSDIHEQILATLKSNTLAAMTDEQIAGYLNLMLIRAIGDFRFPKVPLTYKIVPNSNPKDYSFDYPLTQKEINVLLVLVKKFWLQHQIDSENFFIEEYYDRDVKVYSKGNLLKTLQGRYELAIKEEKTAQYNYSRLTADGNAAVGEIHE